jgi:hypothetical protein
LEDFFDQSIKGGWIDSMELIIVHKLFYQISSPEKLGAFFMKAVTERCLNSVEFFISHEALFNRIPIFYLGRALYIASFRNYIEIVNAIIECKRFNNIPYSLPSHLEGNDEYSFQLALKTAQEKEYTEVVEALKNSGRYNSFEEECCVIL